MNHIQNGHVEGHGFVWVTAQSLYQNAHIVLNKAAHSNPKSTQNLFEPIRSCRQQHNTNLNGIHDPSFVR